MTVRLNSELIEILVKLEWSSFVWGHGRGFMSSGGGGPRIRCCPICGGIDLSDSNKNHFNKNVHGHRKNCDLVEMMDLIILDGD